MFSEKDITSEKNNYLQFSQSTSTSVNTHVKECSTYAKLKSELIHNNNNKLINASSSKLRNENKRDPPKYKPSQAFIEKQTNVDLSLTINPQTILETSNTNEQADSFVDLISNSSENSIFSKKNNFESFLEGCQWKKSNLWKSNNKSFVGHLCHFCICLVSISYLINLHIVV